MLLVPFCYKTLIRGATGGTSIQRSTFCNRIVCISKQTCNSSTTESSRLYSTSRIVLAAGSDVQAKPSGSGTSSSRGSSPPPKLNEEMILGIQNATLLLIQYGLGKKHLLEVAKDSRGRPQSTLVPRWQRMMQGYLGSQVHILAGLGYSPDENGVSLYQYQYNEFLSTAAPETQEKLRKLGRDVWRQVLSIAFDIPQDQMMAMIMNNSSKKKSGYSSNSQEVEELSIVDARNIMFQVAQKMIEPTLLESIARQVANASSITSNSSNSNQEQQQHALMAIKHTLVQQVLVNEVYLGDNGKLLQECGFPPGEEGYVALQCAIAEYQTDPVVAQYMGGAMMRVLQAAGLDSATREMASNINRHAAAAAAAAPNNDSQG